MVTSLFPCIQHTLSLTAFSPTHTHTHSHPWCYSSCLLAAFSSVDYNRYTAVRAKKKKEKKKCCTLMFVCLVHCITCRPVCECTCPHVHIIRRYKWSLQVCFCVFIRMPRARLYLVLNIMTFPSCSHVWHRFLSSSRFICQTDKLRTPLLPSAPPWQACNTPSE